MSRFGEIGHTPRNLAMVAAGISLAIFGPADFAGAKGKLPNSPSDTNRIYHSGESFTAAPDLPVNIKGWKLLIPKIKVEKYGQNIKDGPNTLQAIDLELATPGSGDIQTPSLTLQEGGGIFATFAGPNETDYVMFADPVPNESSYLITKRTSYTLKGGDYIKKPINTRTYTVDVKSYNEKQTAKQKADYANPVVWSEKNVSQAKLNQVANLDHLLDNYNFPPDIYIYDSGKGGQGSQLDINTNRIQISSANFTNPQFPNQYGVDVFTDLSFSLFRSQLEQTDDLTEVVNLTNAYWNLAQASGLPIPVEIDPWEGPSGTMENGPFSIFDMSHYLADLSKVESGGRTYGVPYRSTEDLFAAGLTVMRYKPFELINKLKSSQFTTDQQKAAAHAGLQIIYFLRHYPDTYEGDVRKIVPHAQELEAAFASVPGAMDPVNPLWPSSKSENYISQKKISPAIGSSFVSKLAR